MFLFSGLLADFLEIVFGIDEFNTFHEIVYEISSLKLLWSRKVEI